VSQSEPEIRVKKNGKWRRIYAEQNGQDISHFWYGPQKIRLGDFAAVRVAGIGGVATDKAHRRRGLAQSVLTHGLQIMKEEGYPAVGLYTTRRIVAHRLYRHFGFVDIFQRRRFYKLLDPARFIERLLLRAVTDYPQLQRRRVTLRLHIDSRDPINVCIEGPAVTLLPKPPRSVNLVLTTSAQVLVALWRRNIRLSYAESANQLSWDGDRTLYDMLDATLGVEPDPINEE